MKIYSVLQSDELRNQFIIMATSFLKTHPHRTLHVYTDVKLPRISRLVQHSFYEPLETEGKFCFVSPTLVFRAPIDELFERTNEFNEHCYMNQEPNHKPDLFIHTAGVDEEIGGEDLRFNLGTPEFRDLGGIVDTFQKMSVASVINTRMFKPWEEQRDNAATMSFGWHQYLEAIENAHSYLDKDFVDSVSKMAVKHSFMAVYDKKIGEINEILSSLAE